MKVLLIKDVKSLGKAGQIKEAKDGYANNFLIAKGYAKPATDAVLRQYEANKKKEAENAAYELSQNQALAKELEKVKLELVVKIGANGMLFGSVTKDEIAKALKEQKNFDIDKKVLEFSPIKSVGEYEICAKLKYGVQANFIVNIKGE